MSAAIRVGIDVGGTFTDFVALDRANGALTTRKEPSRPDDPSAAIAAGLRHLVEIAGLDPDRVELVVHGTTLALNALIARRGQPTGLVISEGFGDILVIGRGDLPNSASFKDPKRKPPIPRRHVYEIPARQRPDGTVLTRPQETDLDTVAARARADELTALGVLVLNSYAHPELEAEIAVGLRERLPDVLVTASADLWPEVREFERALVTTLNGSIHGLMNGYYGRLEERVFAAGIRAPVHVTTSHGGTMGLDTARRRPIETLLSGPASGVTAAARLAGALDLGDIVTLDVGGTSSDLAIVTGGAPETVNETRVGDFAIMLPVVHVWAIGAGGGSIVWADDQGVLKVGPGSAGADPGPIAYGRGGTDVTVTDCLLVLGLVDPQQFLSGRMWLDRAAAETGLAALGGALGFQSADRATETATAALRIALAKMATEIQKGMAQRGLDPADFTLVPYGGGGPTLAALLAREARITRLVVPPSPATFCALGGVLAPVKRDFARSSRVTLGRDADAAARIRSVVEALRADAADWIASEEVARDDTRIEVFADMQYPRTATETTVAIPDRVWQDGDAAALADCFHAEHERLYTFRDTASPVDVTTLRVRVVGAVPDVRLPERSGGSSASKPAGARTLFLGGERVRVPVYEAASLGDGDRLTGPVVVELGDSTTVVPAGFSLRVDRWGCLHLASEGTKR